MEEFLKTLTGYFKQQDLGNYSWIFVVILVIIGVASSAYLYFKLKHQDVKLTALEVEHDVAEEKKIEEKANTQLTNSSNKIKELNSDINKIDNNLKDLENNKEKINNEIKNATSWPDIDKLNKNN